MASNLCHDPPVGLAVLAAAALLAVAPGAKLGVGIAPVGAVEARGSLWVTLSAEAKLVQVNPLTSKIGAKIKVGAEPLAVASGAGSLWVANASSATVSRVNPKTRKVVKTIKVGIRPYDVAFGGGAVWVSNLTDGTVSRIDPKRNKVVKTIRAGKEPNGLVFAFGAVWVGDRTGNALLKISAQTNTVVGSLALSAPDWVTPDEDALWVSEETGSVAKVDPSSLTLAGRVTVGANPLHTAVVGDALWVPNIDDSTISIVDRAALKTAETVPGPEGAIAVATAGGSAWVSGWRASELWRFP